jgi:hypothetical protein
MADKSSLQRKSGTSRDQTDDSSRDIAPGAKATKAAKNIEGWLRSKELQPPS